MPVDMNIFNRNNSNAVSLGQLFAPNVGLNLQDLVNFSTNDTSHQTQTTTTFAPTTTTMNLIAPVWAIGSQGVNSAMNQNPNISPTNNNNPAMERAGGAGINASVLVLGVVIIAALYFGIQIMDKKDPARMTEAAGNASSKNIKAAKK